MELKISVRSPPARPGQFEGFLEGGEGSSSSHQGAPPSRPSQLGGFLEGGEGRRPPTARITREVRMISVCV